MCLICRAKNYLKRHCLRKKETDSFPLEQKVGPQSLTHRTTQLKSNRQSKANAALFQICPANILYIQKGLRQRFQSSNFSEYMLSFARIEDQSKAIEQALTVT